MVEIHEQAQQLQAPASSPQQPEGQEHNVSFYMLMVHVDER